MFFFLFFILVFNLILIKTEEDFKVTAPEYHVLSTEKILQQHEKLREFIVHENSEMVEMSETETPQWMKDLSISMEKIVPNATIYPRGVSYRTNRPIAQNDTIVTIPTNSILTIDKALQSELKPVFQTYQDIPEAFILGLYLLHECAKEKQSQWFSYISEMPKLPANLVMLPPSFVELTSGSYLGRLLTSRTSLLINFYDDYEEILTSENPNSKLGKPYFSIEEFTKENLAWAVGMVWSRAMLLDYVNPTTNEKSVRPYLIPIIDTMKICDNCTTQFLTDGKTMTLMATKNYAKYEEIQVSAPVMDTYTYLLYYGMYRESEAMPMGIPFIVTVDPSDALYEKKQMIFNELNMSMNGSYVLAHKAHSAVNEELLMSMRIKVLIEEESDKYTNIREGNLVSPRNEYAVCRSLRSTFTTLLKQYKSTMEEDENFIATVNENDSTANDNTANMMEKNIRRVLLLEKQILQDAIKDIENYWQSLLFNEAF